MIYSSACAHAIRALSQLVIMSSDRFVLLDELCDEADLPRHFVGKIFQNLVHQGILVSARGRGGGFALARSPSEITLWDVVEVVDGVGEMDQCVVGIARCDDSQPCPQHDEWKGIRSQIKRYLRETTLEKAGNTLRGKLDRYGTTHREEGKAQK